MKKLVFSSVKWPKHVDFDRPEDEGLEGAVNFYLDTPDGAKIGVWHVLPASMVEESRGKDREWYELQLGKGVPIVIYMHGNTGSRYELISGNNLASFQQMLFDALKIVKKLL